MNRSPSEYMRYRNVFFHLISKENTSMVVYSLEFMRWPRAVVFYVCVFSDALLRIGSRGHFPPGGGIS